MMEKIRKSVSSILFFSAIFLGVTSIFFVGNHTARAQIGGGLPASNVPLYGAAWSSNIGWVSFNSCEVDLSDGTENCPPDSIAYSVQVNSSTGNLTGAAWSSNIGWLQFGGLAGFPDGFGTESVNANIVFTNGKVRGWARFSAGADDPNDGWDGWVSMSGNNHPSPQLDGNGGVTYDPDLGKLIGATWGGPVAGWLYFGDRTNSWPNVWYGLPDAEPAEPIQYEMSAVPLQVDVPQGGAGHISVVIEYSSGEAEEITLSADPSEFAEGVEISLSSYECSLSSVNDECVLTATVADVSASVGFQGNFIVKGISDGSSTERQTEQISFTITEPQEPPPTISCRAEGPNGLYGGRFFFLYDTVTWRVSIEDGEVDDPEYVWSGDGSVEICNEPTCQVSYTTVGPKFTQVSIDGGVEFNDCPVTFIIPGGLFFREI